MKAKLRLPKPGTALGVLALIIALSGTAYGLGRGSVGARELGPLKLRVGKVQDLDSTAGDGQFNVARGHARCKRGEQLISGGVRLRKAGGFFFTTPRVVMQDSGPVPRFRQWFVTLDSDLGGAARKKYVVFAYCLAR